MDLRLAAPRLAALATLAVLACAHGPSSRDRRSAEIHHDLGAEAIRAGRWPDALRELDEAIALDDGFADAHRARALVLDLGFNRLQDAEKSYRRAIALRPAYSEAHNDLGQLLARTGRWDEAAKEFDLALDNMLYKEPYVARCNKGLAIYLSGHKNEGIAQLRSCVASAPGYCRGRRDLGRALLDEKRTKEALDELSAYARFCERFPDAHLQLGLARMKSGDVGGARTEFERCRDLGEGTPEGEECRRSLALLE
jgi:type IV pilus assembly protein PilF